MFVLDNIKPFNSCFYYNCIHTCLFAIIDANGGDYRKIMISGIPSFEVLDGREGIFTKFDFLESYKQLICEQGISAERFPVLESKVCIDYIIKFLSINQPVIVSVDCYELPYRNDLYHIGEWPHSLLIYGYDRDEKIFMVIDQPEIDNITFQRYEISLDSLARSISCYEKKRLNNNKYSGDSLVAFQCYREGKKYDSISLIKQWKVNRRKKSDCVYQGIAQAEKQLQKILNQLSNSEYRIQYGYEIIDGLNDIVKQRRWENYLLNTISPNDDICQKQSDLLQQWIDIRNKIALIVMSNKIRKKTLEKLQILASTVFLSEKEYEDFYEEDDNES